MWLRLSFSKSTHARWCSYQTRWKMTRLGTVRQLKPIINFFKHFMNTTSLFINQDKVSRSMHVFQNDIKISHKLCLWNKFNPLNQYMNISSLKQYIFPFGLFDHIKYKANIIPLIFRYFIIFLNFAKHAYNREKSIFLKFRC